MLKGFRVCRGLGIAGFRVFFVYSQVQFPPLPALGAQTLEFARKVSELLLGSPVALQSGHPFGVGYFVREPVTKNPKP